jgi:glycosyltransferase involved in cell wall biosynthesis
MTSYLYPFDRKLVIVTVISDLVTDSRVHRTCQTLHDNGYRVLLIGSIRKGSIELKTRDYQTDRLKTWFKKSALFYIEFNIRLFLRLIRLRGDIFLGNDLDVMPATLSVARLNKVPIVYDTHEYFLGMAGMDQKPLRRAVWKFVESQVFSRLKYIYTVSESIRNAYRRDYLKKLSVVRNVPLLQNHSSDFTLEERTWIKSIELRIPAIKNLLLLQGAGLNEFRGVEEMVYAMIFLEASTFHLLIIGGGDVFGKLEKIIEQNQLTEKITLIQKMPFGVLSHFTRKAKLGISIDKAFVTNHKYSLPNKFFEYLHAGVPVLSSRLIEQEKLINQYDVGGFIEDHQPENIARKIREIFDNSEVLDRWKHNTCLARQELNWENESKILLDIFKQVEKDSVNK